MSFIFDEVRDCCPALTDADSCWAIASRGLGSRCSLDYPDRWTLAFLILRLLPLTMLGSLASGFSLNVVEKLLIVRFKSLLCGVLTGLIRGVRNGLELLSTLEV